MKNLFFFINIFIFFSPFILNADEPNDKPLTLLDCYTLALKQSETIAIDLNLIKETEARFLQSLGALLPHISFSSFEQTRDSGQTSSSATVSPRNSFERKFVLKQTLFSGFKEFAAMKGSSLEHSQRINEKTRAQQLLFEDVANAFYLLLEERQDLNTIQAIRTTLTERIDFLKERENVGRARHSEVVSAEAQLYNLEAELELVKSQEAIARQLLEFLIIRPANNIIDSDNALPSLNPEKDYLTKADLRPDVLASEQAWGVDKKKIDIARSGFFPTLSLESNYFAQRNTFPKDSKWDAKLSVDIPIFEGTQTYGALQEATLKAYESELQFKHVKRSAIQDIRDAYVKVEAAVLRTNAFQKALSSAQDNYELQKEDYKLNLVNNLDVLQAIQSLEDTKRNLNHSLYETKRLYWHLRVTVGETAGKE